MVGAFLLTLREGFEATLLVAIVLAYLSRIGHERGFREVWCGVGAAVLVSLATAGALFATAGALVGTAGAVFKVAAMWLAVGFLTYMVLWMRRQSRTVAQGLRYGVDAAIDKGGGLALAALCVRDGVTRRHRDGAIHVRRKSDLGAPRGRGRRRGRSRLRYRARLRGLRRGQTHKPGRVLQDHGGVAHRGGGWALGSWGGDFGDRGPYPGSLLSLVGLRRTCRS